MKKSVLIVLALMLVLCVAGGAMAESFEYVYRKSIPVRKVVDGEIVSVSTQSFYVARAYVSYNVKWSTMWSGGEQYRYPTNAVYGGRGVIPMTLSLDQRATSDSAIQVNKTVPYTLNVQTKSFGVSGRCYSEGREVDGYTQFLGSTNYWFAMPATSRTYGKKKIN